MTVETPETTPAEPEVAEATSSDEAVEADADESADTEATEQDDDAEDSDVEDSEDADAEAEDEDADAEDEDDEVTRRNVARLLTKLPATLCLETDLHNYFLLWQNEKLKKYFLLQ